MDTTRLPSASRFYRRMFLLSIGISAGTVGLTSVYLAALLRLAPGQWWGFAQITAGSFVVLAVAVNEVHKRMFAPVLFALDRRRHARLAPDELRRAFQGACDLPLRTFASGAFWWTLGGVMVAAGMKLRYDDFGAFPFAVMVAAASSGGLVTSLFNAFLVKRTCEPVRAWLGAELGDTGLRGGAARAVPLRHKLRASIAGVSLVLALFTVFLAHVRSRRPLEEHATRLQRALLADARASLASADAAGVAELGERARRLEIAERVARIGPGPGTAAPTWLGAEELRWIASGGEAGDSRGLDSPHVFAFVRLADGSAVVAATPWSRLPGAQSGSGVVFAAVLALAVAISWALASVLARDIGDAASQLRTQADRVASGDLRRGFVLESEDELGDLARSFERMVGWLRETVGRVAEAAEGVAVTARELEGVGSEVAEATAEQVSGVGSARGSVEELREAVAGIASQAASLGESVEESSSTGMELRATGEELNRTARSLSERVEEVRGALVEASARVAEVKGEAEALGRAAGETSSSMEEMASSLREVDAAAGEMGRLSGGVVEQAEVGRERVRQTIEGMEAIREAVEVAEGVMRGLGLRAREIGAIVDVIDEVADETNLLALNAAIIAAQSGESGRAFSVVADEIKELADRVMASTKEIAGLIQAVQEESAQAQAAIEGGARSVLSGVELSAQAGEALEAITASARSSGERVRSIAGAVREQSRAAGHVVGLMEGVREGVERIRTAGAEQERGHAVVGAAVGAMREVAGSVHRTTEEQARGAARIGESVEGVREATAAIHRRLREQSEACAQAAAGLGRVAGRTRTHEDSVRRMAEATRSLRERAASLRTDVERFAI
jgi:methyl-accepting chemotaxis protein